MPGPPPGPVRDVRPGLLHLLDRLDDTPAMVCDAKYDVLAWNAMAAALIADFSALPPGERNIIWRFFTDPDVRGRHDADGARRFARESVADLRAATARYPGDAGVRRWSTGSWPPAPSSAASGPSGTCRPAGRPASASAIPLSAGSTSTVRRCTTRTVTSGWCCTRRRPARPSHEALRLLRVVGTQDLATRG